MEAFTLTTFYWFASVGLLVGLVLNIFFTDDDTSFLLNIAGGALGAILAGWASIQFDLGANIAFAFLGSIGWLFIQNVFKDHAHREGITPKRSN
jgi:uncharacterized membrane protein YeaQ/YmgE (transglycosylase-associated protein family)